MTLEAIKNGQIILIDKPLHWTSFQVVNKLKWAILKKYHLKRIKIGHAGTLDPLASGLLVICTGGFTKKIEAIQAQTKVYSGVITLGSTTPSYDLETPINEHFPTQHITPKMVENIKSKFLGEIEQQPPIFSAIKKDGKRLYEFARAGKEIEVPTRKIHIYNLDLQLIGINIHFVVQCSKGTYIRSLANDIGKALNSGGHLTALRREQIGNYLVTNAFSPTDFIATLQPQNIFHQ